MSAPVYFVTDFPDANGQQQRLRFGTPLAHIRASRVEEVAPALAKIEAATRHGAWAVGTIAYEAAAGLDAKLATVQTPKNSPHPAFLLDFALFDAPDAEAEFAPGASTHPPHANAQTPPAPAWQVDETPAAYAQKIATVRQAIAAGDMYQVNYTLRAQAQGNSDFSPWHYYEALRQRQQAAYSAWLDFGNYQVLSLSPELFFDWCRNTGTITTRPMKGTAPRGATPGQDAANAQHLQSSPKERAENVMIVDLLRNDLGRIAQTGSVHVPHLLQTEPYPTLWQMTSTVQATTRPDVDLLDVLRALFPCGSVTGAPKRMAMQKIAELESSPRGVYCGAVGIVNAGRAVFNVAIRTVTCAAGKSMQCGVGGGITWLSSAQAEYDEALLKMRFLQTPPLPVPRYGLRETLLLAHGRYALLPLHQSRIAQSAQACNFRPVSHAQRKAALQAFADEHPQGLWRVALTQTAQGALQVQGSMLQGNFSAPGVGWAETDAAPLNWLQAPAAHAATPALPVAVAAQANAVDAGWLLHKTTERTHYDALLQQVPNAWDVILHNAQGFATECTRGNIVLQTREGCITPPLHHGLLPGTLRQALLGRGVIQEQPIALHRLLHPQAGDRLWFINSVRGWLPLAL